MPFISSRDPSGRVVRTVVTGPLTFGDIRQHLDELRQSGGWTRPELVDARHLGHVDFSPRDMLRVASLARGALGGRAVAPRAIVVDTDRGFMIARVFASFVAGWIRIGVFEELEAAEEWLVDASKHAWLAARGVTHS